MHPRIRFGIVVAASLTLLALQGFANPAQAQTPPPLPDPNAPPKPGKGSSNPGFNPGSKPGTGPNTGPNTGPKAGPNTGPGKTVTMSPAEQQVHSQLAAYLANLKKQPGARGIGNLITPIEFAINKGGPLYAKDPAACARIYYQLAQRCVQHFQQAPNASALFRESIGAMTNALKLCQTQKGPARQAWTLRFFFDKIIADWNALGERIRAHHKLGHNYLKMGYYLEAEVAFQYCRAYLNDLMTNDPRKISVLLRGIHIDLARTQIIQGKVKDASLSIQGALRAIPDLPTFNSNPKATFQKNPQAYQNALNSLSQALQKNGNNVDLLFVLAHECFFIGQKNQCFQLVQRILKIQPKHLGALTFQRAAADSPTQQRIAVLIQKLGSPTQEIQQAAQQKLFQEGRWALALLEQHAKSSSDPNVVQRAKNLIQAINKATVPNK